MTARDVVFIAVTLFMIAIGFFSVHYISGVAQDALLTDSSFNTSSAANAAVKTMGTTADRLDVVFFAFFMGLVLALMVSAYFIGGHPIFTWVYFIVIILTIIISAVLTDTWETVTETTIFGSTIDSFPITQHILLKFPFYMALVGFIGLVIMFAKPKRGNASWD